MSTRKKNTRARGADKEKQFEEILNVAKNLYVLKGKVGMRELARKLGMSEANLYNYVESRRELWIAIRQKCLSEYQDEFNDLRNQYEKEKWSFIDFCIKWIEKYLEFANIDYPRFQIMQFIPAPPHSTDKNGNLKEPGPFEKKYRPFRFIEQGVETFLKVAKDNNIEIEDPVALFYYIYSICVGVAKAESDLRKSQKAMSSHKAEMVYEPVLLKKDILNPQEFRKFALKEIKERLRKEIT
jgi:AcrR family transcriptional regulator